MFYYIIIEFSPIVRSPIILLILFVGILSCGSSSVGSIVIGTKFSLDSIFKFDKSKENLGLSLRFLSKSTAIALDEVLLKIGLFYLTDFLKDPFFLWLNFLNWWNILFSIKCLIRFISFSNLISSNSISSRKIPNSLKIKNLWAIWRSTYPLSKYVESFTLLFGSLNRTWVFESGSLYVIYLYIFSLVS